MDQLQAQVDGAPQVPTNAAPPLTQSPSAIEKKLFQPFIDEYLDVLKSQNFDRFLAIIQRDRLAAETFNDLRPVLGESITIEKIRNCFDQSVVPDLKKALQGTTFSRMEVRRVTWLDADREVRLAIRCWLPNGVGFTVAFDLVRDAKNRWQMFDWQGTSTQMSTSTTLALLSIIEAPNVNPEVQQFANNLSAAMNALQSDDLEGAATSLQQLPPVLMPTKIQAIAWLLNGRLAFASEQMDIAVEWFNQLDQLNQAPLGYGIHQATALLAQKKYEAALQVADRYRKDLGADPEVQTVTGFALLTTGRQQEAAEAFRIGLQDSPTDPECLIGLALALPDNQQAELKSYFAQLDDLALFSYLVNEMLRERLYSVARLLLDTYEQMHPENLTVAFYRAQTALEQGEFAEAARLFELPLAKITDDQQRYEFLEGYWDAMLELKEELTAYQKAAEPLNAFTFMAERLATDQTNVGRLQALIAAHQQKEPESPWIKYFASKAAVLENNPQQAIQLLKAGWQQTRDGNYPDQVQEVFRFNGTFHLIAQNQPLEAYNSFPDKSTFLQVAESLKATGNAADLSQLITRYAATMPNDKILFFWQIELAWLQKNYAQLIPSLQRWLAQQQQKTADQIAAEQDANPGMPTDYWAYNYLVRGLLQLQKYPQALEYARQAKELVSDPFLEFLTLVVSGDVPAATRLFKEYQTHFQTNARLILADPDLAPALKKPGFENLQQELAWALPALAQDKPLPTPPNP